MDEDLLNLIESLAQTVYDLRAPRRRVPRRLRDKIGDRDGWICRICEQPVDRDRQWIRAVPGEPFPPGANNLYPSVEHVTSVGAGGTNDEANLAICHLVCNSAQSHDGREAGNYAEIRRATAATDVLNAVARIRAAGLDRADELMPWQRVEVLLDHFKEAGRAAETLPVRKYLRERTRLGDTL